SAACESAHSCRNHRLSPARPAGLCTVVVQLVGAGLGRRRTLSLRNAWYQHRLSSAADAPWVCLPALAGARADDPGRVLLAGQPHELGSSPPYAPSTLRLAG